MRLRKIVEGKEYPRIQVRVYNIYGQDDLFGECAYINGELISLDGDSYNLDAEINEYGVFDDVLIVVEHTIWLTGDNTMIDTRNIECVNAIDRIKRLREGLA